MTAAPQFIRSLPVPRAGDADHTHLLRSVGIYSDLQAHAAAMPLLCRLALGCRGETKISALWFSFDRLKLQTKREIAAARAAKADMLWYSGCSDQRPPASVRALIDSWSQGNGMSERAVVALFQAPIEGTRGAHAAEEVLRDLVRSRRPLFIRRLQREAPPADEPRSREPEVASRFTH
jgi:hypothetical protein